MKLYGAYGSNLNLKQMQRRCPNSYPLYSIYLENYILAFKCSRYRKTKEVSVLWQFMKLQNLAKSFRYV